MALPAGTNLGPYRIVGPLGAGGMGEVYRATDTRLGRTVAIKVLPASVADDPALKTRFEREARAIAALNHPHICVLHDVGDASPQPPIPGTPSVSYLVMEYLDGETLAQRLVRGPLPLDRALTHAVEIADALEKAHRKGIVHRDLKPGNIMLTGSGAKLLDFGLARLRPPTPQDAVLSGAPTASPPLTGQGSIVGTFQYMAPEQLEGREADARSDIFAFGSTVYEMLTGRRAFEGPTQASLIAAIMSTEPLPVSAHQKLVPGALDFVVRTCLAKDPDRRWQSAGDVGRQLEGIRQGASRRDLAASPGGASVPIARVGLLVAVVASALALALALLTWLRPVSEEVREPIRFAVPAPAPLEPFSPAVSPDGRYLAFVAGSARQIFLRPVDSVESQPLPGTEGAAYEPFWSPDSQHIGFAAMGTLKRVAIAGGPPRDVAELGGIYVGASWSANDDIVVSAGTAIMHVPASGGEPVTLFPGGFAPWFLPDGRRFLYTGTDGVYVGSLDSIQSLRVVDEPGRAMYVPSGHLVFNRQDVLLTQSFDPDRATLTGEPVTLARGVAVGSPIPLGGYSVSDTGVLAYASGTGNTLSTRLTWYDRQGNALGSVGEPGVYRGIALSPDGRLVIVHRHQEPTGGNLWLLDQDRGALTRFSFDASHDVFPVWSPDGRAVVFASASGAGVRLLRKASSGAGEAVELGVGLGSPVDWAPDGEALLLESDSNIVRLPLAGEPTASSVVSGPYTQIFASLSPDSRFVAYASNESGAFQVYVRPYPEPTAKWQVSTGNGNYPRWAPAGDDLFYLTDDGTVMVVDVDSRGDEISLGVPSALFQTKVMFGNHSQAYPVIDMPYDVSADGDRFLINERIDDAQDLLSAAGLSAITVVVNWDAGLVP